MSNQANRISGMFIADRDRRRDVSPGTPDSPVTSPSHWLDFHAGTRYAGVTVDGFDISAADPDEGRAKSIAVETCREYVYNWPRHLAGGEGLCFVGPKGTGKDHLLVAVLRAIANRYQFSRIKYRSGAAFFDEFTDSIGDRSGKSFRTVADSFARAGVLAISDPLPPVGELSESKKDMIFRVLTDRYKDCRPTCATINVGTADELERRMGSQAADRLRDNAIFVKCNWPSYREPSK